MKTLKNILEGVLDNVDIAVDKMDQDVTDIYRLQGNYAFLNNLPSKNKKYVKGGINRIYKAYFKSVPVIDTNIFCTLPNIKNGAKTYKYKKLDTAGEYLAAYILSMKLDKPIESYNFSNLRDIDELNDKLNEHIKPILNNDGLKYIKLCARYYPSSGPGMLSIDLESTFNPDFKIEDRFERIYKSQMHCDQIIELNFTKGQYYPVNY